MCNRQRNIPDPQRVRDLPRHSRKLQGWFPAWCVDHFDVAPAHAASPARPQRFHRGLFRGKTRCVTLKLFLVALAIGYFPRRIKASQNRAAAPRKHLLNAFDLLDVQSQSNDHASSSLLAARIPAFLQRGNYTYNDLSALDERQAMNRTTKTRVQRRKAPTKRTVPAGRHWSLLSARGLQTLTALPLANLDWLVHGFSTRPGGTSELRTNGGDPDRVLNLGFTDWDDRSAVLQNRAQFAASIGAAQMRTVALRQIHSDLAHAIAASKSEAILQGDALFTREPGVLLTVQTADCIPILFADNRTRAIAAVHSGWRGTLKRVAEKTLGRMRMEFGTRPEDVIAAIGPGIGGCCYEVGHEVAKEFAAQFPSARGWFEGPFDAIASGDNDPNWLPWLTMAPPGHAPEPPRVHLNLPLANRDILLAAGVPPENIFVSEFCTSCRTDLFFSYRKERRTGRMMAAIGIRKTEN